MTENSITERTILHRSILMSRKLCCCENLDCKADGICSNVSVLSEYLSSAFHNFSRH